MALAFTVNCFVLLFYRELGCHPFFSLLISCVGRIGGARLDKTTFINLLNVSCLQSNTSAVISTSAINSVRSLVKLQVYQTALKSNTNVAL